MNLRAVSSHASEAVHVPDASEDRSAKSEATVADSQKWRSNPEQLQAHRDMVRLVSLGLAASGCTQDRAARLLGTSLRDVQAKLDPEGTKRLPASALLLLARSVTGLGEVLGVALATSAPAARTGVARSPESHVMRLSAIVGDLAERTDEALADGALSETERRDLARLHQQAIERSKAALRDLGES